MSEATKKEIEYARTCHNSGRLISCIVQAAQDRGCDIHTNNKKWHDVAEAMIDAYVDEIIHIYRLTGRKPPFKMIEGDLIDGPP